MRPRTLKDHTASSAESEPYGAPRLSRSVVEVAGAAELRGRGGGSGGSKTGWIPAGNGRWSQEGFLMCET